MMQNRYHDHDFVSLGIIFEDYCAQALTKAGGLDLTLYNCNDQKFPVIFQSLKLEPMIDCSTISQTKINSLFRPLKRNYPALDFVVFYKSFQPAANEKLYIFQVSLRKSDFNEKMKVFFNNSVETTFSKDLAKIQALKQIITGLEVNYVYMYLIEDLEKSNFKQKLLDINEKEREKLFILPAGENFEDLQILSKIIKNEQQ